MNDKQAEKIITKFILEEKKRGITKLCAYEIGQAVNVSIGQIQRIMDKFVKEKKVKEVEN